MSYYKNYFNNVIAQCRTDDDDDDDDDDVELIKQIPDRDHSPAARNACCKVATEVFISFNR